MKNLCIKHIFHFIESILASTFSSKKVLSHQAFLRNIIFETFYLTSIHMWNQWRIQKITKEMVFIYESLVFSNSHYYHFIVLIRDMATSIPKSNFCSILKHVFNWTHNNLLLFCDATKIHFVHVSNTCYATATAVICQKR